MKQDLEHLRRCRATLWRIWQYMSPPDEPWEEMAHQFQRWAEETLNGTGPLAVPNAFQDEHSDVVEALRAAVFELERGRHSGARSDALDRIIADAREALTSADQLPVTKAEPSVNIMSVERDRGATSSTHVYCESCKAIKPAIFDRMAGRDVTGRFVAPTDIVCRDCKTIVATLYNDPKLAQAN